MSQGKLLEQIEKELAEMEEATAQTSKFAQRIHSLSDLEAQKAFASAIGLNLHSFYMGAERIFETIAKKVDVKLPTGEDWHKKLLKQMSAEVSNTGTPVISERTFHQLDNLRGFRHVVRSHYAHKLNPERVLELASQLPQCYQHLEQDVRQFCESLNRQSDSEQPIQDEARETTQAVRGLLTELGELQPDGSLTFEGERWRFHRQGDTTTITVKQDNREILRVEGNQVVVFEPNSAEREKLRQLRQNIARDFQQQQQNPGEHRGRGRSR